MCDVLHWDTLLLALGSQPFLACYADLPPQAVELDPFPGRWYCKKKVLLLKFSADRSYNPGCGQQKLLVLCTAFWEVSHLTVAALQMCFIAVVLLTSKPQLKLTSPMVIIEDSMAVSSNMAYRSLCHLQHAEHFDGTTETLGHCILSGTLWRWWPRRAVQRLRTLPL